MVQYFDTVARTAEQTERTGRENIANRSGRAQRANRTCRADSISKTTETSGAEFGRFVQGFRQI